MIRLRVKEVAGQKGISMNRLSRISDVSLNTVRRAFNDPKYNASIETLVKLAKALGVEIGELVEVLPDE